MVGCFRFVPAFWRGSDADEGKSPRVLYCPTVGVVAPPLEGGKNLTRLGQPNAASSTVTLEGNPLESSGLTLFGDLIYQKDVLVL